MNNQKELTKLIKQARECAKCWPEKRNQFVNDLIQLLNNEFARKEEKEYLSEEEFIQKQAVLHYITCSLGIVVERQKLRKEQINSLLHSVFEAMGAVKMEDDLTKSFDNILFIILNASGKLRQEVYDATLEKILKVVEYSTTNPSSSTCPSLLNPIDFFKTESDPEDDVPDFKSLLTDALLSAVFTFNLPSSHVFMNFWSPCRRLLNDSKDTWILKKCLKCAQRSLEIIRAKSSVVEQSTFITEVFSTFPIIATYKDDLKDAIYDIAQLYVKKFIESNGKVLCLRKDLRENTLVWIDVYISLIGENSDEFEVLGVFSRWMAQMTDEIQDTSVAICIAPMEKCVDRIKRILTSSEPDLLPHYLDILTGLFKLAKIHDESQWSWINAEIQKHAVLENPRWPRLLSALLRAQHPANQTFCRKFAPSVDTLWSSIKSEGSASETIYSLAFILSATLDFDEGGKQLLPILLLPCYRDFRERMGVKRDNFRFVIGGARGPPVELRDLEKYTQMLDYGDSLKLRAVHCALLIEKKTGHFVNLVAEMALAVFSKSRADQITTCLPALFHFLAEHSSFINDFLICLVAKLGENEDQETILTMCRTIRKLICYSANRSKNCSKCQKNRTLFVAPDPIEHLRLDERSLALFVKSIMEHRKNQSEEVLAELLEMCRVILLHVDSSRLPAVFTPLVKSIYLGFSTNAECFFRVWELISARNTANEERKLQIYIPVLARTFSQLSVAPNELNKFMERVHEARLSNTVKVALLSALFAHSVSTDEHRDVLDNWIDHFARNLIPERRSPEERTRGVVKRYATIFTRSFVSRLLFHVAEKFDELSARETVRSFFSGVTVHFKFPDLSSTVSLLRSSLLYWSLVSGVYHPLLVCSTLDFLCQELTIPTTSGDSVSVNLNPIDGQQMIQKRKLLIMNHFRDLVQFWAFETCRGNEGVWRVCEAHCGFTENDMKSAVAFYRKDVFERLLLVTPEVFIQPPEGNLIVSELQKTYENLKKGEKFSLTTALDTRKEGTEFLFAYRSYFTEEVHFWMRDRAVSSFHLVLQHAKQDFFHTNWWTILATLRNSPCHLEGTRLSWIQFVESIHYSILRQNIWRILTDLARIEDNSVVIECIWNRLKYANDIEKIANDDMTRRIFWMIPIEVEKKVDLDFTIGKSRRIEDVFEFIHQFHRYPSLQFVDSLSSKIERGTVWKDDLPRLLGAITGILPACQSDLQRRQVCSVLQKLPICNSELADNEFSRWGSSAFFSEPIQLTQAVLEECVLSVETMTSAGKLKYADRTLCEVYKFFNENSVDSERRSSLAAIRDMYSTMNCYQKPDPLMIESKSIDEMVMSAQSDRWLTMIIVKCAEIVGDSSNCPLVSLAPIAHLQDQRFLAKLAMRFILTVIYNGRESVAQWIRTTFEDALNSANSHRMTSSERNAASFIFYVFDFLYHYINTEDVRKRKTVWREVIKFWKCMLSWTAKDEHGHSQPLLVKVATTMGMEKRCILWMEFYMELLKEKDEQLGGEVETSYYFTVMNLYARIHELNGVRGAFARLSRVHIGHFYGKICMREAFGDVAAAANICKITGKGKPFDPNEAIRKLIEEQNTLEYPPDDQIEQEEYITSMKNLSRWMQVDKNFGPSPHVFSRTIEHRATESSILTMIRDGEEKEVVDRVIEKARMKTIERMTECALGGSCSYETATPFLVQIHQLDELSRIKDASVESLVSTESELWKSLQKRTDGGVQRMDLLEPILRARRSVLSIRMKSLGELQKVAIKSQIVDSHLQSARIARLTGCQENAQLAITNAKKVLPFDNRIVLEEAKLQLQTSDELSGMNLLNSIIDKTFGELSKHYGDTQQSRNLDLQKTAKGQIDMFPVETKNLFSSVQMLRISHMIKAGNTIEFEKIYNDTMNLLNAFVSSGVMYEAAWLLDYLFHHNERNKHVLPLLKAYKEVAFFETNRVLQARAVERMMSLWLSNTKRINAIISSGKASSAAASEMLQNIKMMNREITNALDRIGLRAFYPAYAVLCRFIDHSDEDVFRTIKNIMQQLILRMPHQCMWQSVNLLRQDDAATRSRYMEVLTHVKRKAPCFMTLIDQYDYASAVFNMVPAKVDSDKCKLSERVEGLRMLIRERKYDPKELIIDRRVDGECKTICGIMVPVRSEIDLSVHSMDLPEGYEESCMIPDRYLIHDFSDSVKVLHSKTKPVLIELITKAGRRVRLICKKEDELNKDYHFTKIVEMCNDLLVKDEQTRIQNMAATTYSVIPLAKHGGIIEFMEGVIPFYETLDRHMPKPNQFNQQVARWAEQMKALGSKEKKVEFFRHEMCEKSPLVMAKWFRVEYPEAGKWFASRKLFAKSTAVMSMIGYIFGLGDRHTKNLMVHVPTGKCVHVDFDMIFNKGETLPHPEVVPFRLTRNMVNGMGEVALEGEFRTVCEQTLRVFRENSFEIEKYIVDLPNLVTDFVNLKDFDMTEAKRLVSGRLRGQITTAKIYRGNPISHPMHVSQLASSLIELATSDEKLSEMFEGWMPTL